MKLFPNLNDLRQKLFRRKSNHFLCRLIEQSQLVIAGTLALQDYMKKPSKKNAAQVRQLERDADEVRRILIDELNRTFVTPIDREDLFGLSRAVDDILDHAYSTINEMDMLNVAPNNYLMLMVELLHNSAEELKLALERLEHHPSVAESHTVHMKANENRMENLYSEALADLFKKPDNLQDVVEMMKLREIYRHMYHAGQSVDDAANIIADIIIKFY
jgi:uncharacterized protein Yka (UPF0111/DUF47 family)